jgi:hypothetical protein
MRRKREYFRYRMKEAVDRGGKRVLTVETVGLG